MDRQEEQNLREKYKGYGTEGLLIKVLIKLEKMRREKNGTGSYRMDSDADDVRACVADVDADKKIALELGITEQNWADACATPTGAAMVKFLLPLLFPLDVLLQSTYKGGKVGHGRKPKKALDPDIMSKLRDVVMKKHMMSQQDFGSAVNKKLNQLQNLKKNSKGTSKGRGRSIEKRKAEDTNEGLNEISNNVVDVSNKSESSVTSIKLKISLTRSKRTKRSLSSSHKDEPKQKKMKEKPIANVKLYCS